MIRIFILVAPVLILLSGCGSGSGRRFIDGSPLTEAQRNVLMGALRTTGDTVGAGERAVPHNTTLVTLATNDMNDMLREMKAGKCEGHFSEPKNSLRSLNMVDFALPGAGRYRWDLLVDGNTCPVYLKHIEDLSITDKLRWSMNSDINYYVKKESFKKWTDISAFRFQGSTRGDFNSGAMQATWRGSHSGSITSVKYGTIDVATDIDVRMSKDSVSGEIAILFQLPDNRAVFRVVYTGSGPDSVQAKFLLNGETISKGDFRSYMEKPKFRIIPEL